MVKVNVGSGKRNFGLDWLHVDGQYYPHNNGKDVFLTHLWGDEKFDLIYSSHLIAYFDRAGIQQLLKAWFHKLKPGGTVRIATPDFEAMTHLYKGGLHLNYILGPMYGKMAMSNETIYHKTVYDFNGLAQVLWDAGFTDVKRYDHTKTEHAEHDDHSAAYIQGTLISLNVEATKPI